MDVLTPEQRTKNMKAIKSKNTQIEVRLAKAMFSRGLRYRRNNQGVFGNPDFTFRGLKIAVFCDSEYFHGKDWERLKDRIRTNTEFWQAKISRNMQRDELVNDTLFKDGWKVIRFWGQDIKKNMDICISTIENSINERKKAVK